MPPLIPDDEARARQADGLGVREAAPLATLRELQAGGGVPQRELAVVPDEDRAIALEDRERPHAPTELEHGRGYASPDGAGDHAHSVPDERRANTRSPATTGRLPCPAMPARVPSHVHATIASLSVPSLV